MISDSDILNAIPHVLTGVDVPTLGAKISGKVRDIYMGDGQRVIVTTDRVSAFDRVLGCIPFKGQVLNQLSAWWFAQTQDIVPNHVIRVPDPNVTIGREAVALPVEIVVRGFITGVTSTSLWTMYEKGDRTPYGIALPEGLQKNDALPQPIITPTTKALDGAHDEQITREGILARGLVAPHIWEQIEQVAIALFLRGQDLARRVGWILVDTKYEFGLYNGQLVLIDEVHTPDSSRFWTLDSYERGNPQNFSKEFLREWFIQHGYRGEGNIPPMPNEFVVDVAKRYIHAYEQLTQQTFVAGAQPAQDRIQHLLAQPHFA
jgi:phosphoribosylaminoimidazole-succinocarboxamide synthase